MLGSAKGLFPLIFLIQKLMCLFMENIIWSATTSAIDPRQVYSVINSECKLRTPIVQTDGTRDQRIMCSQNKKRLCQHPNSKLLCPKRMKHITTDQLVSSQNDKTLFATDNKKARYPQSAPSPSHSQPSQPAGSPKWVSVAMSDPDPVPA
jgi:hypothetical protein